jgi:hypothetical protein
MALGKEPNSGSDWCAGYVGLDGNGMHVLSVSHTSESAAGGWQLN